MKCMKSITISLVIVMMFSACSLNNASVVAPNNPDNKDNVSVDENTDELANNGVDISGFANQNSGNGALALYDKSYKTVEELMSDAAIIVRATPIAKEVDSFIGTCWILQIKESSQSGVTSVRLRQVKDNYLLKMGQEVVLVLKAEGDMGYYGIPGGGDGLFRVNEETGRVEGNLLEELVGGNKSVTLDEVYDLLVEKF